MKYLEKFVYMYPKNPTDVLVFQYTGSDQFCYTADMGIFKIIPGDFVIVASNPVADLIEFDSIESFKPTEVHVLYSGTKDVISNLILTCYLITKEYDND